VGGTAVEAQLKTINPIDPIYRQGFLPILSDIRPDNGTKKVTLAIAIVVITFAVPNEIPNTDDA